MSYWFKIELSWMIIMCFLYGVLLLIIFRVCGCVVKDGRWFVDVERYFIGVYEGYGKSLWERMMREGLRR